jgi:hypothetical protein
MEQNRTPFTPEAKTAAGQPATDEPASSETPCPPAPFETRRQRRARHDGFTSARQAVFLEAPAERATVTRAAAAAGRQCRRHAPLS